MKATFLSSESFEFDVIDIGQLAASVKMKVAEWMRKGDFRGTSASLNNETNLAIGEGKTLTRPNTWWLSSISGVSSLHVDVWEFRN